MELTRRDALAALAAGGVGVGAGAVTTREGSDTDRSRVDTPEPSGTDHGLGAHTRKTLVAVARVVYPADVTGLERFVYTYLDGRTADRPEHADGLEAAVQQLDGMGEDWHGGAFVDLDPATRDQLLRETGADTAEPDPGGSPAERIRYYLINELLFALYSSPTGGKLVGIENPQGHPGGLESYQRGPRP